MTFLFRPRRLFTQLFFSLALVFILFVSPPRAESAGSNTARIKGSQALDNAAKAWETIYDYQTVIHQTENHRNGTVNEFWARISLIRPIENKPGLDPRFLLEFYDKPIPPNPAVRSIGSATPPIPIKIYYTDTSRKLFTYNPKVNSLTIENLDDRTGPLPEFFYLAGFLDFNVEELKEKAYIRSTVEIETVDGVETYKIRIEPRDKMKGNVFPRELWVDRETYMPRKFVVYGTVEVDVLFGENIINQNLNGEILVPEVPENVFIDNKTR